MYKKSINLKGLLPAIGSRARNVGSSIGSAAASTGKKLKKLITPKSKAVEAPPIERPPGPLTPDELTEGFFPKVAPPSKFNRALKGTWEGAKDIGHGALRLGGGYGLDTTIHHPSVSTWLQRQAPKDPEGGWLYQRQKDLQQVFPRHFFTALGAGTAGSRFLKYAPTRAAKITHRIGEGLGHGTAVTGGITGYYAGRGTGDTEGKQDLFDYLQSDEEPDEIKYPIMNKAWHGGRKAFNDMIEQNVPVAEAREAAIKFYNKQKDAYEQQLKKIEQAEQDTSNIYTPSTERQMPTQTQATMPQQQNATVVPSQATTPQTTVPPKDLNFWQSMPNWQKGLTLGGGALGLAGLSHMLTRSKDDEEEEGKFPIIPSLVGAAGLAGGAHYLSGGDYSKLVDPAFWKSSAHMPVVLVPYNIKFALTAPSASTLTEALKPKPLYAPNAPDSFKELNPDNTRTPTYTAPALAGRVEQFQQQQQAKQEFEKQYPKYQPYQSTVAKGTGNFVLDSLIKPVSQALKYPAIPSHLDQTKPWLYKDEKDQTNFFKNIRPEDRQYGHDLLREHAPQSTQAYEQATGYKPPQEVEMSGLRRWFAGDTEAKQKGQRIVPPGTADRLAKRMAEINPTANTPEQGVPKLVKDLQKTNPNASSADLWTMAKTLWGTLSETQKWLVGGGLALSAISLLTTLTGASSGATMPLLGLGGLAAAAYGSGLFDSKSTQRQMIGGMFGVDKPNQPQEQAKIPPRPEALTPVSANFLAQKGWTKEHVSAIVDRANKGIDPFTGQKVDAAIAQQRATHWFARHDPSAQQAILGMFHDDPAKQQAIAQMYKNDIGIYQDWHKQHAEQWRRQYEPTRIEKSVDAVNPPQNLPLPLKMLYGLGQGATKYVTN